MPEFSPELSARLSTMTTAFGNTLRWPPLAQGGPAVLALALVWLLALPVFAQTPVAAPSPAAASEPSALPFSVSAAALQPDAATSADSRDSLLSAPTLTPSPAFSAAQIIDLLQTNPDLAVELKSQVADRLQIDANNISDQMLFDQIEANPSLRMSITVFLRARGYVSEDALQVAANSDEATGNPAPLGLRDHSSLQDETLAVGLASGTAGLQPRNTAIGSGTALPTMKSAWSALPAAGRNSERVTSSTDEPKVLRRPAPYNLRSMRDLYTQLPNDSVALKRFGSEVFLNRNATAAGRGALSSDVPLDVPSGPDYVVGPGDALQIDLWGGITQSIARTIGREGRILLPEAGSLSVAGLSLERVQNLVEGMLRPQYRNVQVAVSIARLHSVRVYVTGDVQRPGGYDLSSLATPLSALYAAGGPTGAGSLRMAHHLRGRQLIETVDLYDFLLHGVRASSARFESGDTLHIPPAGAQVAISGAVRRPAIYELKAGESTLAAVIADAGGLTPAASLGHISVERIDANQRRETVALPLAGEIGLDAAHQAIDTFAVKDGDRIRVEAILPYSERAVYLEGHVARPGRLPYSDGMRLSDVLRSYRDLLPEPAASGEIVRLVAPDLHAVTLAFNLPDVLIGNTNLALQPFDTVRVFGRYENDAPKVAIRGEVLRPGSYPLSEGMTAAELVRMAGGFKRDALLESADLTSYRVVDGKQVEENIATVKIGVAVTGSDPAADAPLRPGDILSIHQITGWDNIGESVTISGQVRYPGSYGFKDGDRLSSLLRRVGGLLPTAYPRGAVLVRDQVRELEEKSRDELVRQIETNSAAARLSPNLAGSDSGATLQLIKAQQEQALSDLKSHPPTGRMVIHIDADISKWENTSADIELRPGDMLTIPKQPGFVLITGQVYNATAVTFTPDKTAAWYVSRSGGTNSTANRREIFIIRANGSVVGRRSGGWFDADVLSTKLNPGDVVVVPQKIVGASLFWRNLLSAAQLASSIAITAAVASL